MHSEFIWDKNTVFFVKNHSTTPEWDSDVKKNILISCSVIYLFICLAAVIW